MPGSQTTCLTEIASDLIEESKRLKELEKKLWQLSETDQRDTAIIEVKSKYQAIDQLISSFHHDIQLQSKSEAVFGTHLAHGEQVRILQAKIDLLDETQATEVLTKFQNKVERIVNPSSDSSYHDNLARKALQTKTPEETKGTLISFLIRLLDKVKNALGITPKNEAKSTSQSVLEEAAEKAEKIMPKL